MNIQVTQENLQQALGIAQRVVGQRTTLPVLANVLLQTEKNRLKIIATNLEMAVTAWVGAKIETDGEITIPARLLTEYISNLPSATLSLRAEKNILSVSGGSYNSKINGIEADDFPSIPQVTPRQTLSIASEVLKSGLSQVVNVASRDSSRPVLSGVYLYGDSSSLCAVATDSYRLAEKKLHIELKEKLAVIVPARSIIELLRGIDDTMAEKVEVSIDDNQICFRLGEIELISRLIDGQFPDYRQLIPSNYSTKVTIDAHELGAVTKVTNLFARENAGSVTIAASDGVFSIRSLANQVGENKSATTAEVEGEDIEVSVNGRYLAEATAAISTERISIEFSGKLSPVLFKPVGDDSYLHIVMPLRS